MTQPKITRRKLADYRPSPINPNQHTERGLQVIEDSINYNGAGRSGLVAKDGTFIAGHGTWEAMERAGIDEVIEVEADGHQWVIVRRTDLDPDDPRSKALMVADNRASELSYAPDDELLGAILADIAADDEKWVRAAGFNQWEIENLLRAAEAPDDPYAHWQGMPEFEHDDLMDGAAFTIRVFLKDADDLAAFGRLLGKDLTGKKFIWFSEQPRGNLHEVHDEQGL